MDEVTLHSLDKKIDILIYQNENNCKRIETVEHDINGNGKEGLKKTVIKMGVYWKILAAVVTLMLIPLAVMAIANLIK